MGAAGDVVLEVRGLEVEFRTKMGVGRAVKGVSFRLARGETLGLVGESGCGKSVTSLAILGLHPRPAATIVGGEVLLLGQNLVALSERELRRYRGKRIGFIPQDPLTSLNPVYTIGSQLFESLELHTPLRGDALRAHAVRLLRSLHIAAPEERIDAYPHQLSGGMRQRIVSAIAFAGEPDVLIADEPTTALDATVQAAYLDLLNRIQRERGTAVLLVTHDFAVVAQTCTRVAVMYASRIVETAPTEALYDAPLHPYTQALMAAVPSLDSTQTRLTSIPGQPPSIYAALPGCPFAPRCVHAMDRCRVEFPPMKAAASGHEVACWLHA